MARQNLASARRELELAIEARDPRRIAVATARVAAADPRTTRVLLAALKLAPLVPKIVERKDFSTLGGWEIRRLFAAELKKQRGSGNIDIAPEDVRLVLNAATHGIRHIRKHRPK